MFGVMVMVRASDQQVVGGFNNNPELIPLYHSSTCAVNKLMVTERRRKPKIGTMEAHHTANP